MSLWSMEHHRYNFLLAGADRMSLIALLCAVVAFPAGRVVRQARSRDAAAVFFFLASNCLLFDTLLWWVSIDKRGGSRLS
jgi:hypothetical protein